MMTKKIFAILWLTALLWPDFLFADNYGDRAVGSTLNIKCSTLGSSGPATISGGVISVYKDGSTTQTTTGVTYTAGFDSVTGLHNILIDTSTDGTFYSAGSTFELIVTTGTVSGTSIIGMSCGSFSLTATTPLSVGSVTGNIMGSVGSVASGGITAASIAADAIGASEIAADAVTEIQSGLATSTAVAAVQSDTDDVQTRLPAALVSGRIDASVGAMAADTVTASSVATDAVAEIQSGLATSTAVAAVQSDTDDVQSRLPSALVSGRMDASVGAMAANTVTASALATDAVTEIAAGIAFPSAASIADATWDEATAGHSTAGTFGVAISSSSDPWSTLLPGSYGAGTAGAILATRAASGANVVLSNPVASGGTLTIKQGDDYSSSDNVPIDFSYTGAYDPTSPTSITLKIYLGQVQVASFTGSVIGTSAPWTLRFQPSASSTTLLTARNGYRYDVEVVKSARKRTLVESVCNVTAD